MPDEVIEVAALGSRYLLAFILLAAAIPKLVDARGFQSALENYRLLPQSLVGVVARWIPRIELTCALMLLVGLAVPAVAALAATLLLLFAAAMAVNLVRGRSIDCGCGASTARRPIRWRLVAGDLVLSLVAVGLVLSESGALPEIGGDETTSTTAARALGSRTSRRAAG